MPQIAASLFTLHAAFKRPMCSGFSYVAAASFATHSWPACFASQITSIEITNTPRVHVHGRGAPGNAAYAP